MAKSKEQYEYKRQQKFSSQKRASRQRRVKTIAISAVIIFLVAAGLWALIRYERSRPETPEAEVISRRGIHWHPTLEIIIKGEEQKISANIGIGVTHAPFHTHDTSGTIHMEKQGLITKDDTKLGKFFEVWGMRFDANCIFDRCNGPDGSVKMLVNGEENSEFDQYPMKDKDRIEIRYE